MATQERSTVMVLDAPIDQESEMTPVPPAPRRKFPVRMVVLLVLLVAVGVGTKFGYDYFQESQRYVTTDNAQFTGVTIQIGSMNNGRVATLPFTIGDRVRAGDVVAQIELP